ncbi:MAG: hypothetical protein EBQ80_00105 [Proteobacteria bacterium]|nr:hypothetical protein [Pseudomonadota bacterium]
MQGIKGVEDVKDIKGAGRLMMTGLIVAPSLLAVWDKTAGDVAEVCRVGQLLAVCLSDVREHFELAA